MYCNELRKKSDAELQKSLKTLSSNLEKLSRDILQKKENNVTKLGAIRKDIARVKTVMVERKSK